MKFPAANNYCSEKEKFPHVQILFHSSVVTPFPKPLSGFAAKH